MDIIKASFDKGYNTGYIQGMINATDACALIAADMIRSIHSSTQIDHVIFNDPATIVFWKDGTKTIVKAYGEKFDKEKGLAMAISRKALGNSGSYYKVFKKYCPEEDLPVGDITAC